MLTSFPDEHFMKEAYKEAVYAFEEGEVPVGAVVVCNNRIIARAHNQTERLTDVTAHAEMVALTAAANFLGSKYLNECTLFVTLEPCIMCAGALQWAQLERLVFAASDEKHGYAKLNQSILHPKTEVISGIMEKECGQLLKDFFNGLRG
ncbi:MAG TPA: nucleoside deaminase [Cytophagaceae bacterium]|nr:nucleoside deaminase [Cytophagaceae bacterium]